MHSRTPIMYVYVLKSFSRTVWLGYWKKVIFNWPSQKNKKICNILLGGLVLDNLSHSIYKFLGVFFIKLCRFMHKTNNILLGG